MKQLTETQSSLLQFVKDTGDTTLAEIAKKLGKCAPHMQRLARELECRGYLVIAPKRHKTDVIHISVSGQVAGIVRPNFDKLMFSTAWV